MTSLRSAADTGLPKIDQSAGPDLLKLDSAIYDATMMASLTVEFVGRALGLDDGETRLNDQDAELLTFAVMETKVMTSRIRALFDGLENKSC